MPTSTRLECSRRGSAVTSPLSAGRHGIRQRVRPGARAAASIAIAIVLLASASPPGRVDASPVGACRPSVQANKAVVAAFYKLALGDMNPRAAFARYAAPGFVEHSDDGTGSAEATVRFLEDIIRKSPKPHWEIIRSAAEGDLVFLHVRFTPAAAGPQIAVVEIFRLHQCRLTEHWDVISHPPAHPINRNSRF